MIEAIIKGIIAGLAYGMLLGPLFFLGLQVTLKKGLRNGLSLAFGAVLSDAILAIGGCWSSTKLLALIEQDFFQSALGTVGALLIIGFGISVVLPQRNASPKNLLVGVGTHRLSFVKGFTLNMANPSNWLFWFGLATVARADAPATITNYTAILIAAALLMLLITNIAKVVLADKIGTLLRPGLTGKIVQWSGGVLIAIGVFALIQLFVIP